MNIDEYYSKLRAAKELQHANANKKSLNGAPSYVENRSVFGKSKKKEDYKTPKPSSNRSQGMPSNVQNRSVVDKTYTGTKKNPGSQGMPSNVMNRSVYKKNTTPSTSEYLSKKGANGMPSNATGLATTKYGQDNAGIARKTYKDGGNGMPSDVARAQGFDKRNSLHKTGANGMPTGVNNITSKNRNSVVAKTAKYEDGGNGMPANVAKNQGLDKRSALSVRGANGMPTGAAENSTNNNKPNYNAVIPESKNKMESIISTMNNKVALSKMSAADRERLLTDFDEAFGEWYTGMMDSGVSDGVAKSKFKVDTAKYRDFLKKNGYYDK